MNSITNLQDRYANLEEVKLNTNLKQNTLEDIKAYSQAGIKIIPLYKHTKIASIKEWQSKENLNLEALSYSIHDESNFGIRLDYQFPDGNYLVVTDIEDTMPEDILKHFSVELNFEENIIPWSKTQSGGIHLFFKTDKKLAPMLIKKDNETVVELRIGNEQYVAVAPSVCRDIVSKGGFETAKRSHDWKSGKFDKSANYDQLFSGAEKPYYTYGNILDAPFISSNELIQAFHKLEAFLGAGVPNLTTKDENSGADQQTTSDKKAAIPTWRFELLKNNCAYLKALIDKMQETKYLDHPERIWLASLMKPFGEDLIFNYFSQLDDYDKPYTKIQIDSLDRNPARCLSKRCDLAKNSSSETSNICRKCQCDKIMALNKISPIAFSYKTQEQIDSAAKVFKACKGAESEIIMVDDMNTVDVLRQAGVENVLYFERTMDRMTLETIESYRKKNIIVCKNDFQFEEIIKSIISSSNLKPFVFVKESVGLYDTVTKLLETGTPDELRKYLYSKAVSGVRWMGEYYKKGLSEKGDLAKVSTFTEAAVFGGIIRDEILLSNYIEILAKEKEIDKSALKKSISTHRDKYRSKELVENYAKKVNKQVNDISNSSERYFPFIDTGTVSLCYLDKKISDVKIGVGFSILSQILASAGQVMPENFPVLKVTFDPMKNDRVDQESETFNLFTPTEYMLMEKTEETISLERDCPNIYKLIVNLFPVESEREHFLNWLSCIMQTRQKTETAWVLLGKQGTGKGLFLNKICKPLFGQSQVYQIEDERLKSEFNGYLQNVMMVAFNEVANEDNSARNAVKNKIKAIVSDPEIWINEKNIKPFPLKNFVNCFFFSNEAVPVFVEDSDRRLNIVRTGIPFKDQEWFAQDPHKFVSSLSLDLKNFAQFLMNYKIDLSKAKQVIRNDEKENLVNASMNRYEEFAKYLKEKNVNWFEENMEQFGFDTIDVKKAIEHVTDSSGNQIGRVLKDDAIKIFQRIYSEGTTSKKTLTTKLSLYGIAPKRLSDGDKKQYYYWKL